MNDDRSSLIVVLPKVWEGKRERRRERDLFMIQYRTPYAGAPTHTQTLLGPQHPTPNTSHPTPRTQYATPRHLSSRWDRLQRKEGRKGKREGKGRKKKKREGKKKKKKKKNRMIQKGSCKIFRKGFATDIDENRDAWNGDGMAE